MGKQLPCTGCPEDFALTEKTIARIEREYPTVDIQKTLQKFVLQSEAKGWMYRNWQSAFVNYCDNGKAYGGVVYQEGPKQDPRWVQILAEVTPYGFRAPQTHETPQSYRTEFEQWKRFDKRSPVIEFGNILKVMK